MRYVKLYELTCKQVLVSPAQEYIEQCQYDPYQNTTLVQNAHEIVLDQNIKNLEFPIRKFCEEYPSGEIVEEYIAFDPRLLKILGIEIDNQKKLDVAHNVIKDIKVKYEQSVSKLTKYESMTFCGHIKEAFNKLFGGKN